MSNSGLYLADCAHVIDDEIAAGIKQSDIALTYALAMRSAAAGVWEADWPRVNRAIINRWSRAGLERVKRLAHQYLQQPSTPPAIDAAQPGRE